MAKILVVDDDLVYLDELSEGLRSLGHHVACAASATEAMNSIDTDRFEIVICDMIMAGGGAVSLMHQLQTLLPAMPFIVITGRPEIASSPIFLDGMKEASAKIEKSTSLFEINELVRDILK